MKSFLTTFFVFSILAASAQATLVAPYTSAANRSKLYNSMIKYSINKNLSRLLSDSTEENWIDAFYTLELLNYRSAWINGKIDKAVDYIPNGGLEFQRALLELLFTNYKTIYFKKIDSLSLITADPKIYAMSLEYLIADPIRTINKQLLIQRTIEKFTEALGSNTILQMLLFSLKDEAAQISNQMLEDIFKPEFLKENNILFSVQRKNRDYTGLAFVRDASGNFLQTDSSKLFTVPHFARSLSSLPSYLTNGNTPQGIFKMYGFAVSASQFIGPSANIQLCLPVECSITKFFSDSSLIDSSWSKIVYENLLPASLKNYFPIYGSYYSGAAGRTEIISHGTTVDPKYYSGKPYYPHTPSMGCLTTSEIWDDNGRRIASNQQKLVDALLKAGGANGYCVVIEISGKGPVSASEILPFLPKAKK